MNEVRMMVWWVSEVKAQIHGVKTVIFAVELKRAKAIGGSWMMGWWVSAAQKPKEAVDCTAAPGESFAVAQFLSHLHKMLYVSRQAQSARGCSVLPCPPLYSQTDHGGRSRRLVGLQANVRHWHPPDCCTSK